MAQPKYLTTKELLQKLNRIEEINDKLDKHIQENNDKHEEFHDEFEKLFHEEEAKIAELKAKLDKIYDKYFAAKRRFDSE